MGTDFTCETLREPCLTLFQELKASVPTELAGRLKCNRVVQPHGTNRNVLLWRVWDARLPKLGYDQRYSCVCLNFDPTHFYNQRSTWLLHLYFNTHRVYRHSNAVRSLMIRRLPKICPPGFEFSADERTVQLCWHFNNLGRPSELVSKVSPKFVEITKALAPVFDELVELVERPASESERTAIVASRPRPTSRSATVVKWEDGAVFSRGISPGLRARVLAKYSGACALCGEPLGDDIHIDHIVPWSKGGLTELSNLQPTHESCNLAKGNRIA